MLEPLACSSSLAKLGDRRNVYPEVAWEGGNVPSVTRFFSLVLVYLLHRYQTQAAITVIGGLDYRYTVRGDGQAAPRLVPAVQQRAALAAVVRTLSPEILTLPETLLRQLPPRTPGMRTALDGSPTVESFVSHTSVTFDPVTAAQSAADLTLADLFQPARANRLLEYHARDASEPTLEEIIDAALGAANSAPNSPGLAVLISTAIKARIFEALFRLGSDPETSFAVRATLVAKLHAVKASLPSDANGLELKRRIDSFESDPEKFKPQPVLKSPPGSPIGDEEVF